MQERNKNVKRERERIISTRACLVSSFIRDDISLCHLFRAFLLHMIIDRCRFIKSPIPQLSNSYLRYFVHSLCSSISQMTDRRAREIAISRIEYRIRERARRAARVFREAQRTLLLGRRIWRIQRSPHSFPSNSISHRAEPPTAPDAAAPPMTPGALFASLRLSYEA